jgi:hypothetical protein
VPELGGMWASLEEASRRNQQLRVGIEPSEPAGGIRGARDAEEGACRPGGPIGLDLQWGASPARSGGGPRPRPPVPLVPAPELPPSPALSLSFLIPRVSRAGGSLYPPPKFSGTGPYLTKSSDSGLAPGDYSQQVVHESTSRATRSMSQVAHVS